MLYRRIVFAFSALVVMTAFSAMGAHAANLFVSSTGNDNNPCSAAAPCASIGQAVSIAPPGSRITVLPGTYREMVTITSPVSLIGRNATIDAMGEDNGIFVDSSMAVTPPGPASRASRSRTPHSRASWSKTRRPSPLWGTQ